MTERFIIQRATTKEVLSYDFPGISRGPVGSPLSAVGSLTLTLGPSAAMQVAADGNPVFWEQGTIVTLDDEGTIRFRGIVDSITYPDQSAQIVVKSMARYLFGKPYEGAPYYGAQVDPADIVRLLVAHVQSFPDSNIGLTVTGKTSVRTGSFSTQNKADTLEAYTAAVNAYNAENAKLKTLRDAVSDARSGYSALVRQSEAANAELSAAKKAKDQARIAAAQTAVNQVTNAKAAQQGIITQRSDAVDAQAGVVARKKADKDAAYAAKVAASKAAKDDGGAYTLLPWEAPDCGSKLNDLASSTPFDWYERSTWDRNDLPQTELVIAYPRLGRRLSGDGDPSFVQGVNIVTELEPESNENATNSVFGVGAGEGVGAIRRTITIRNGKLRQVATFTSKDVKSATDMDARLRVELAARTPTLAVSRITVLDHPNSPRGSYNRGDDIFVQGDVPRYGRFGLWHRIVDLADNPDGTTECDLELTDSFTYGTGVPQ
ncbi:hypothetical protein HUN59_14870 [Curtobacterium sp. Csp2]|uniref:hypothetical protein n=1 Tax=Curtobacterium sp. Csp2 TaxID=2495430 RepID=UPI001580E127|nr:hypothetical protein [Curtobacterium sp. Csp2]QKS17321.1 hypothetical protein HUN59_14870 [Curtobacterium sp. Csp2]